MLLLDMDRPAKTISITIESHLFLGDFNRLVEQLGKLEGFAFIIKSKTYTSESLKDEKVTITSSDLYSDAYNLKTNT
jgi:hypothetical protein